MAVLSNHRGQGVGAALLDAAVEKARHLGFSKVYLHAQTHALGFYKRLGFKKDEEEFMEAGIPHYHMTQRLLPPDDNIQRKANINGNQRFSLKPVDRTKMT